MVALAVLGSWLDFMILRVFSNLVDSIRPKIWARIEKVHLTLCFLRTLCQSALSVCSSNGATLWIPQGWVQGCSCTGMREGVLEEGPSPVTFTQSHSILGKAGLMQQRCPLLPLLLLHIPSYKKLPSHPREVSAHSASPKRTQQR